MVSVSSRCSQPQIHLVFPQSVPSKTCAKVNVGDTDIWKDTLAVEDKVSATSPTSATRVMRCGAQFSGHAAQYGSLGADGLGAANGE